MNLTVSQLAKNRDNNKTMDHNQAMNRHTHKLSKQLTAMPRMAVAFILLVITLGFTTAATAQNFGIRSTAPTAITAENCVPDNDAIDPGEQVSVRFAFTNNTGRTVNNLVVTLQSSGGVLSPSGSQVVPSVANGAAVELTFSFL